jgi:CDP-glycerol glycerophosphotransferase (TagB/SpsB family)
VGIQHGIVYPKHFAYRHDADETDCPVPDRTAVFGDAARRFLEERGHYAPGSLVVTGSPKFDELLEAARSWDREALRARFGIAPEERLVVVASRYRGIRETFQSIGSAFASLLRAIEAMGGVRCLVKPHPAEKPDAYEADVRRTGVERSRVLAPGADLMELLHASDALVTVESLSAVEALVLGRPVLILNMPTNLRELVEQGVALGVAAGEDPGPPLRSLLFDRDAAARLAAARERYLSDLAMGVDGRATRRILELVRDTARRGVMVG